MMTDVPCKNCIVLAICKSLIGTFPFEDVTNLARSKDCSLLLEYIDSNSLDTIDNARRFFGLPPVYGRVG